jgi:2-amino-4-hydroxy-6-hydroxymethyldihydropteridine diphosphokinase
VPPIEEVFLSLGSNLGDRLAFLRRTIELLPGFGVYVRTVSSIYETEPVNVAGGGWFLNCALRGETIFSAPDLLDRLLALESDVGRDRRVEARDVDGQKDGPRAPRTIDIDLLYYGRLVRHDGAISVPHPRLRSRRFVLEPLAELAPEWRDPEVNLTVRELLAALPSAERVRRLGTLVELRDPTGERAS